MSRAAKAKASTRQPEGEPEGAPAAADGPERRCVATGLSLPVAALVRCVVGPDGALVIDAEGKLPGRGLWVSARRDAVEQAVRKGAFPRAAKGPVAVPADLADRIEARLLARCTALLGLARRAGLLLAGFAKVAEALAAGRGAALVQAADASADGKAKIARLAAGLPRVEILSSAEIGLAIGRENVVHAVLSPGGLTSSFLNEAQRLAGFRSQPKPPLVDGPDWEPELA